VCADVLHYVGSEELARGLAAMRRLAGGLVYAPAFTTADDFVGDREGWHARSPHAYRRAFGAAGFRAVRSGLLGVRAPRRPRQRARAL
jgi:hypothetical protein